MKRGPQPKNAAARQRRNASPSLLSVVPALTQREVPPVPVPAKGQKVLAKTRDSWAAFWQSEIAAVVADTDLPALHRLFLLRDQWERYSREVFARPLVDGSMGQPVENPLAKRMDRIAGEIRQLEDRFGMNPGAKAKLGVQVGDAVRSADDLSRRLAADDDDDLQILDVAAVGDSEPS